MLCTSNVDEISEIVLIPLSINRRIKRECQLMRDNCDEIIVEYTIDEKIFVSFRKKSNRYSFYINRDYPFSPPKLNINGISVESFFNLRTKGFQNILKYITGLDCLCCNSYLCPGNWSPAITFDKVIQQIEEFKYYKYLICIKLILDKIKEKYLNRDIDLDSWLFNICFQHAYYEEKYNH